MAASSGVNQDVQFVDGLGDDGPRRPPKMFHRKSRTGCQRCRARRVKCNEVHPICGNCQRHRLPCVYDRVKQPVSEPAKSDAVDTSPPGHSPASANSRTDHSRVSPVPAEYAESRDRRLLELRLLNHFVSVAGPTLGADQHASEALTNLGPNLAMSNDALLYGILAVSAFHASHCDPGNPEYVDAYRLYYGLAIVEHRKDVAKGITRENSDVLILTSTFLRVATMVELQERSMDPYEPPFRVLQIIHAAGTVFKEAYQLWKDEEDSLVVRFVKGVPVAAGGEDWYLPEYRLSLLHLLRRMPADEEQEAWDDEIKETYEKTLSVLGRTMSLFHSGETAPNMFRRLLVWPMMIPMAFPRLLQNQQPRAMVIVAHYFALLSTFEQLWWVGGCGRREVLAIRDHLPPAWLELMAWPLETLNQRIAFKSSGNSPGESDKVNKVPMWKPGVLGMIAKNGAEEEVEVEASNLDKQINRMDLR